MSLLNVVSAHKSEVIILPCSFIDRHITTANPSFIAVFLFFYRHYISDPDLSTEFIAEQFGILESDVINIFKYWEKSGVLKLQENDGIFEIEFLFSEKPVATQKPRLKPKRSKVKPSYSIEEIEIYQEESSEVQRLFAIGEKAFGKLLQYNDLNLLFALYDWLRLPINVIETLLNYCAKNGKLGSRYIETIAIDWADKGINTVDAALEYINAISAENANYREIMKALGLSNSNPAPSQIKQMKEWLHSFPLDIVLEACDKTVMNTGKPSFSYTETIIKDWKEKGVKTVDDIKAFSNAFKEKEKRPVKPEQTKPKTNRFANFTQREWDEEQLKRLETLYLEE